MSDIAQYDCFISHASEDKVDFVEPLVAALSHIGITCWYDNSQIILGDPIRRKIDEGISYSKSGILVISERFLHKPWTQYELDGLHQRYISGELRLISILHGVSHQEYQKFSASLASQLYTSTANDSISSMVSKIAKAVRPDLVIEDSKLSIISMFDKLSTQLRYAQAELDRKSREPYVDPSTQAMISSLVKQNIGMQQAARRNSRRK
jgi:hypothetical protein